MKKQIKNLSFKLLKLLVLKSQKEGFKKRKKRGIDIGLEIGKRRLKEGKKGKKDKGNKEKNNYNKIQILRIENKRI